MRTDNTNPYIGLRSFDVDESILFFGRKDQTLELLQGLHQHHFVAVVGSSGCGKSSLLRAGLIPALKAGYLVDDSDHWIITIMKPGQSPLYNLVESLLQQINPGINPGDVSSLLKKIDEEGADAILEVIVPIWKEKKVNFFLLVDQFEELFRFTMNQKDTAKKDEAIDFVNIMLELSQQSKIPFYVVITMRSDFIGECDQFSGLPEAMNKSQYLVPRLNRLELKTAIEGPARLYGGKINPTLTSRLLNEFGKVKDELPLLQHALMRMWDFETNISKSGELDLRDYESIGVLENALNNHANEALQGMSERELQITKKIFQALTVIDQNGRMIRRPVLLSELIAITGADKNELLALINLFIKDKRSFLIIHKTGSVDDKVIDISHESLIRQWNTLCKWVEEEGKSVSNYIHLSKSAALFNQNEKDHLTGMELQNMLAWYNDFKPKEAWAKRYKEGFRESIDYLQASENDWNKKLEIEKSKKKKQRILTYLVFVLLSVITISAGIAAIKFKQLSRVADAKSLVSEAKGISSKDPTLALRLVDGSLALNFDSAAYRLATKIYSEHSFYKITQRGNQEIISTIISPDGKTILAGYADSIARLHDLEGNELLKLSGHKGVVYAVAFSPDGKFILTGSGDHSARLWDLKGTMIHEFINHSGTITALAFSPDGNTILTGSTDNTACLWDLQGNFLHEFSGHLNGINAIAFSPDSKSIITGSFDNTARLWDLDGNTIQQFTGHSKGIYSVAFSPDGKTLLTGSGDSTCILWELNGTQLERFIGHTNSVLSVSFSPDGKSVLSGSSDHTVLLWDLQGDILQKFEGHDLAVFSVGFLQNNKAILTGSKDNTLRFWTLKGITLKEFKDPDDAINASVFSPDGKIIATGSDYGTLRIMNLKGDVLQSVNVHQEAITSVAFSPDGKMILTGSSDSTACLLDMNGNIISTFNGHTAGIRSVTFSPDGKTILSGSFDKTARLWDLKGKTLQVFSGHSNGIYAVAISPDGQSILTGSFDKTARLWDMKGNLIQIFNGHTKGVYSVVFSPDGKTVLTGSGDKSALLWDKKGTIIQEFIAHEYPVEAVAFSPDGKTLLTGSGDKTARLWDLNGNMLQEFKGHTDEVSSVAFSPDGKTFLTGSIDHTTRLWEIPLSFKDFLAGNLAEKLSPDQKKFFGIK